MEQRGSLVLGTRPEGKKTQSQTRARSILNSLVAGARIKMRLQGRFQIMPQPLPCYTGREQNAETDRDCPRKY